MSEKTKIKIIKRTEPRLSNKRAARTKTTRQSARELASTVTDWVSDLKQRKSEEGRTAFDLLFAAQRPVRES